MTDQNPLQFAIVHGPFWWAWVRVEQLSEGEPQDNRAFRTLFVDRHSQRAFDRSRVLLPGTVVLRGWVRSVTIRPDRNRPVYQWREEELGEAAFAHPTPFLVLARSDTWNEEAPRYTCLAGEIRLDHTKTPGQQLYQALGLEPPGEPVPGRPALAVHSGGLSIHGRVRLPWQAGHAEALPALLQLAQVLPGGDKSARGDKSPGYRLTVEADRLTREEKEKLLAAWRALGRTLTPNHPLLRQGGAAATPRWATLEIADLLALPRLYWQIDQWPSGAGAQWALTFEPGTFNLLLSDQEPYDQDAPAASLAHATPVVAIGPSATEPGNLQVSLSSGTPAAEPNHALVYAAQKEATGWSEIVDLRAAETAPSLTFASSPVQTARFLRDHLGLPTPQWSAGADGTGKPKGGVIPSLLWGFMPLEDGWAQLPVPNLSEQLYLDADLANLPQAPPAPEAQEQATLLKGAVSFGNDKREVIAAYEDEQPWNCTLTSISGLDGTWTLAPQGDGFVMSRLALRLHEPDLTLNGLFWLSTSQPTATDALPDLDNWVNGLQAMPLRRHRPDRDLYPALTILRVEAFRFYARPPRANQGTQDFSAALDAWSFRYEVDEGLLNRMEKAGLAPEALFQQHLPLIWQRHPYLPMIQALPLTQSQSPPNHPSASRQLVPFAAPRQHDGQSNWRFDVSPAGRFDVGDGRAAAAWPRFAGTAHPDPAWANPAGSDVPHTDLPLVSLSLPGLILSPNADTLQDRGDLGLGWQYRYDLPYGDEINALAQLPPLPPDPAAERILAEERPAEPPPPLQRDTYAGHWHKLHEQATLAAASAVHALRPPRAHQNGVPAHQNGARADQDGAADVQHLVGPYRWPVSADLQATEYPGTLVLANSDGSDALALREEAALRGIWGPFVLQGDRLRRRLNPGPDEPLYELEAGSMAAHAGDGTRQDQRALARHATQVRNGLLKTEVNQTYRDDTDRLAGRTVELATLLNPLDTDRMDDQGHPWQLWFRDLPLPPAQEGRQTFKRQVSKTAQDLDLDVNDPEARTAEWDYRQGYEWRLGLSGVQAGAELRPLTVNGLHFYPLRLESVTVEGTAVTEAQIAGRLQLPVSGGGELADLSNVVTLTFTRGPHGTQGADSLELGAIRGPHGPREAGEGEWPLSMPKGEAAGHQPRLLWRQLTFENGKVLFDAELQFALFGADWLLDLGRCQIDGAGFFRRLADDGSTIEPGEGVDVVYDRFADDPSMAIERLACTFDLATCQHRVTVTMSVHMGQRSSVDAPPASESGIAWEGRPASEGRLAFRGEIAFRLLPDWAVTWTSGTLFEDITLDAREGLVYRDNTLQLTWQTYREIGKDLQLLPGMYIPASGMAPGFATLSFQACGYQQEGERKAHLSLDLAFMETLLYARWGEFLQADRILGPGQVLNSSAGDLALGYTVQLRSGADALRSGAGADQSKRWEEGFLLNGFLECKNLISWPAVTTDESGKSFRLPSVSQHDNLPHTRHTVRVLFNQHQIPAQMLRPGEGEVLLFDLAEDRSWQFLAVVEHQLVDVDLAGLTAANDRRWTAVQEVRLISPGLLLKFLQEYQKTRVLSPSGKVVDIGSTVQGYLGEDLCGRLQAELAKLAPDTNPVHGRTLLVEASAPFWIRPTAVSANVTTNLQFLPTGSQRAILSSPEDYAPSYPPQGAWQLLAMPFLGRLQPKTDDAFDDDGQPANPTPDNAFQVDPVVYLARGQADGRDLALALANWGDGESATQLALSDFDSPRWRQWERLDPLSLEENWFRLQHPLPEDAPGGPAVRAGLSSVMATLPDTPARLSRAVALAYAFDVYRPAYPPAPPDEEWQQVLYEAASGKGTGSGEAGLDAVIYRPDSLLLFQRVRVKKPSSPQPPYGWAVIGLHLPQGGEGVSRFAAATLLPAQHEVDAGGSAAGEPAGRRRQARDNPLPVSFAVSPYLGMAFQDATGPSELVMASSELLCLERVSGQLRPVASTLDEAKDGEDEHVLHRRRLAWARATRRRLSPDSPVAVLRVREIRRTTDESLRPDSCPLQTTYAFALVDEPGQRRTVGARAHRLRAPAATLAFREGQFGGQQMPETGALRPFEMAPPQTTDVKPLYLDRETPPGSGAGSAESWPWGLSALQLRVQYTEGTQGAAGSDNGHTLWWQALQHAVQYRAAGEVGARAGLPPTFRAPAIRSLLPVLPDPPAPAVDPDLLHTWQPILPGALRYLLLGNRSGVMLSVRNQLISQGNGSTAPHLFVSGSVPVQHRVPRPVPLPPNVDKDNALRTWASYFAAQQTALSGDAPVDEAFWAAYGATPAKRLRVRLASPRHGVIQSNWDGRLQLAFEPHEPTAWDIQLAIVIGENEFPLEGHVPAEGDPEHGEELPAGTARYQVVDLPALRDHLATVAPGGTVTLQARVATPADKGHPGYDEANVGFCQVLSLPLRLGDESIQPLPLAPTYVHFEDPEYNRRLASIPMQAGGAVQVNERGTLIARQFKLATDRQAYNADNLLFVRYDWEEGSAPDDVQAKLAVQRLMPEGIAQPLVLGGPEPYERPIAPGTLVSLSLPEIQRLSNVRFEAGDQLKWTLQVTSPHADRPVEISLVTGIVDEPVVPAPEAGYALLRWRRSGAVECARFAWGPFASRIELVNASDLRTGLVRRRAVFQWTDSVRPGQIAAHAVQKLTLTGSTHFPAGPTNPLTGLPVTPDKLNRRPLEVKMAPPSPAAGPQSGLSRADVVIEYPVGDGTHLAAILLGDDATPELGPLIELRALDRELMSIFKSALVASGCDPEAMAGAAQQEGWVQDERRIICGGPESGGPESRGPESGLIGPFSGADVPLRRVATGDQQGEWTTYSDTDDLWNLCIKRQINDGQALHEMWVFDASPPPGGRAATRLRVAYTAGGVEYRYDVGSRTYRRFDRGRPAVDALTGQQIAPSNVVILYRSLVRVEPGAGRAGLQLSGHGQGTLLRDGRAYDIRWVRENRGQPDDRLLLLSAERKFPLRPGATWMQIVHPDQEVHLDVAAGFAFGDLARLTGYQLEQAEVVAGENLEVTLHWRALQAGSAGYNVCIHLLDPSGNRLAQDDREPAKPTPQWQEGDQIVDPHVVSYWSRPQYAGPATLAVGLYPLKQPDPKDRLPGRDPEGRPLPLEPDWRRNLALLCEVKIVRPR